MRERFEPTEVDPVADVLINRALTIVHDRYGDNSDNPRAYHNVDHTLDVLEATELLGDTAIACCKINPDDKRLLLIAAAYHDTEQSFGSGENEHASAKLAIAHMKETGAFSEEERQKVHRGIMATQANIKNGVITQSAGNYYFGQILADADLASVGRPTAHYMEVVANLFRELHPEEEIGGEAYADFMAEQVFFLNHHRFNTPEADKLFPHKQENVLAIYTMYQPRTVS